jgi:hypothetical protein
MTQPAPREPTWAEAMAYPLACLGAIAGALLGALLTYAASRAGFYAIILVGIAAGFGATIAARRGGWIIATIAILIALVVGLYTEWYTFPFVADDSLTYFIQHLGDLPTFRLLVHAASAAAAGYIAYRR